MVKLGHTGAQVQTFVATAVGALLCLVSRWRGWMLPEGVDVGRLRYARKQ